MGSKQRSPPQPYPHRKQFGYPEPFTDHIHDSDWSQSFNPSMYRTESSPQTFQSQLWSDFFNPEERGGILLRIFGVTFTNVRCQNAEG